MVSAEAVTVAVVASAETVVVTEEDAVDAVVAVVTEGDAVVTVVAEAAAEASELASK